MEENCNNKDSLYLNKGYLLISKINFSIIILIIITTMINICCDNISSILLLLQFFCGIALFCNNYRTGIRLNLLIYVLLDLLFIVIANIYNPAFGSMVIMMNTILFLLTFNEIVLQKKDLANISFIIGIALFIIYITSTKEGVYYFSYWSKKINPNMMGVYLFIALININAYMELKNICLKKLMAILVFVVFTYLIYQTEARTTTFASVIYFLVWIFYNKIYIIRNENKYRRIIKIGWLLTLIISGIYILIYLNTNGNFEIMGKNFFSGREKVWIDAYNYIKESPIFGSGNDDLFNGVFESAHNSLIAIWKTMGIMPMIFFIVLFIIRPIKYKGNYKYNSTYKAALVALLFIATFETCYTDETMYTLCLLPLINKIMVIKKGGVYDR